MLSEKKSGSGAVERAYSLKASSEEMTSKLYTVTNAVS
jgi:hypothetical protein